MELHELQNIWKVLEEQLKKNETVKKKVILEMLHKKSNKSLNRLINVEFINLILWLLTIPIFLWLNTLPYYSQFVSTKIITVSVTIIAVFALIMTVCEIKYLFKINLSQSIKDNMFYLNKYQIMVKRGKIFAYLIMAPILYSLIAYHLYERKTDYSLWMFFIVASVIGIVMTYWMYKTHYDSNIQSIKESLAELAELREE